MKKPHNRQPGMNRTVSMTGEEWAQIKAWAAERGMSAARFLRECALTVDPFAETASARPLVLDAGEQRGLSLALASAARDMGSGAEAPSDLADSMRALLEARLRAMVREGKRERAVDLLREVLGEERGAVVAAALIPETPAMADMPAASSAGTAGAGGPDPEKPA